VLRVLFTTRAAEPWLAEFNALAARRFLDVDAILYGGADAEGITFSYVVDGDVEWCRRQLDELTEAAEIERVRKDEKRRQEEEERRTMAELAAEKADDLVRRFRGGE